MCDKPAGQPATAHLLRSLAAIGARGARGRRLGTANWGSRGSGILFVLRSPEPQSRADLVPAVTRRSYFER